MRSRRLILSLFGCLAVLGLHAQVEKNLSTVTDLSDVYRAKSGKNRMIAIFDMTPISRGISESPDYLSNRARTAFMGTDKGTKPWPGYNGQAGGTEPIYSNTVFSSGLSRSAPILGYVFAICKGANSGLTDSGGNALYYVDVKMFPWPANSDSALALTGRAKQWDSTAPTTDMSLMKDVYWNSDPKVTIPQIEYARFTVTGVPSAAGKGNKPPTTLDRTIDLPCPSKIFDSPSWIDSSGTIDADSGIYKQIKDIPWTRTYQTNTSQVPNHTGIKYDPWSEQEASLSPWSYSNGGNTAHVIGNFFYTPDYLSWIFYGRAIRDASAAATTGDFKWANAPDAFNGFAVPDIDTVVQYDSDIAHTTKAAGWANRLPHMTRYQAQKVAAIDAMLDKIDKFTLYYRFVDPSYGDYGDTPAGGAEELGVYSDKSTYTDDRLNAFKRPDYLSDFRELTETDLKAAALPDKTALQQIGPAILRVPSGGSLPRVTMFETGTEEAQLETYDAWSPSPISAALSNTYRKIWKKAASLGGSCGGDTFVVVFPASAPNDSLEDAGDMKAAWTSTSGGYLSWSNGNLKSKLPAASSEMYPGQDPWHPAALGYFALHGGGANQPNAFDAPWMTDGKPIAVRTMIVSLGIPGCYALGSDHNGRTAHEEYFITAMASDPDISPLNTRPIPAGLSAFYVGKTGVKYYPTCDAAELKAVVGSLTSFIVYASASLSAPATPATGVMNADQAYFGTFSTAATTNTSDRIPVWSGNLYSLGLLRTTVAVPPPIDPVTGLPSGNTTYRNAFLYYGLGGAQIDPTSAVNANFDAINLWSAYDVFGNYQDGTHALVNTAKLIGGTKLGWKDRRVYVYNAGSLVEYEHSANSTTDNTTLLGVIIDQINAMGTKTYKSGSPLVDTNLAKNAGGYNETRNMMRFLIGAFDPTNNERTINRDKLDKIETKSGSNYVVTGDLFSPAHVNIMGDVINSAPQAIELAKSLADEIILADGTTKLKDSAFYGLAYGSTYKDPHTRLIVVGTNTGHLHCFIEVSAKFIDPINNPLELVTSQATELWSFLPPNLMPLLWDMYQNRNNLKAPDEAGAFKHRYAIDGDPALYHKDTPSTGSVIGDSRVGLKEDATLIFGFRKGARDYFGLNISTGGDVLPHAPTLAWWVRPTVGDIVKATGSPDDSVPAIKTMGMSTCVPSFGTMLTNADPPLHQAAVFLTGGYANREVWARYKNDDATTYANGMGNLVLALDPVNGALLKNWSVPQTADTTGIPYSIAGGATPVEVLNLGSGLTHRLYFADIKGNVWVINANANAVNDKFRQDNANYTTWTQIRKLFSNDADRFTTAPHAARLAGDYPSLITNGATPARDVRPLTVMVAVGSGDRNNPADRPEDFTYTPSTGPDVSVSQAPAASNRLYVIADIQKKEDPYDIGDLVVINSSSKTSYTNYLATDIFNTTKRGYYLELPNDPTKVANQQSDAASDYTRDKVMVSPLMKDGVFFYSLFNLHGDTGFTCSPLATTRTFRQCDILRPLYFDPQVDINASRVGDITKLSKYNDGCSGLAFTFSSLSSKLVDTGDYVMQGGARAYTGTDTKLTGSNTPDIQAVKDTGDNRGFRIRSWRIIR